MSCTGEARAQASRVYLRTLGKYSRNTRQARHNAMMQWRGESASDRAMERPFLRSIAIGWECSGI